MKNKLLIVFLAVSLAANGYLWNKFVIKKTAEKEESCFIYPQDQSSIDFPATVIPPKPVFTGYSINGQRIFFLDIFVRGDLLNSVKNKYDIKISEDLVRNIQYLIYFFSEYKIIFNDKDRISLYYRENDKKIVYLRYKSRVDRSIHEGFLTETPSGEAYINANGEYITPCIKNGPFEGCPDIVFEKAKDLLMPVFLLGQVSRVKIPFDGKITALSDNTATGGNIEVTYSEYKIKGNYQYLGRISKVTSGKRYKKGTELGYSGYKKYNNLDGVAYFLKNNEGAVISPFVFHHTEKKQLAESLKTNFSILVNFYRYWYKQGIAYERDNAIK